MNLDMEEKSECQHNQKKFIEKYIGFGLKKWTFN